MAKHNYKVLADNCTLGKQGSTVSIDEDGPVNVAALVAAGTLEPTSKAAKEAVEDNE